METLTKETRYAVKGTYKDGSLPPYLIYDGATFQKDMAVATCNSCNKQWGDRIDFDVVAFRPDNMPTEIIDILLNKAKILIAQYNYPIYEALKDMITSNCANDGDLKDQTFRVFVDKGDEMVEVLECRHNINFGMLDEKELHRAYDTITFKHNENHN